MENETVDEVGFKSCRGRGIFPPTRRSSRVKLVVHGALGAPAAEATAEGFSAKQPRLTPNTMAPRQLREKNRELLSRRDRPMSDLDPLFPGRRLRMTLLRVLNRDAAASL